MIEIDNKELVDDFKDYLRIDKNYSENTIKLLRKFLKI